MALRLKAATWCRTEVRTTLGARAVEKRGASSGLEAVVERGGRLRTSSRAVIRFSSVRKWWNWQTHHLEGVAPKGVGVQIPPSAPVSVQLQLVPSSSPMRSIFCSDPSIFTPIHQSLLLSINSGQLNSGSKVLRAQGNGFAHAQ